jgi:hypothetical protein
VHLARTCQVALAQRFLSDRTRLTAGIDHHRSPDASVDVHDERPQAQEPPFLAPLFGTFLLGMFLKETTPWGGFAGLV